MRQYFQILQLDLLNENLKARYKDPGIALFSVLCEIQSIQLP